ncbi:MAG: hypothetical protein KF760_31905 [Candidatus Eremiobacteraeota bacterium]|nr:hypothetical protein [Candidatus Eremiobacteraeota bacterium]
MIWRKYLALEATEAQFAQARQEMTEQLQSWLKDCQDEELAKLLQSAQVAQELEQLIEIDQELHRSELLSELLRQRWKDNEKAKVLARMNLEVSPSELEAGHFLVLRQMVEERPEEEARAFLQDLWDEFELAHQDYLKTPVGEAEWTLEVAMADDWMEQGYRIWFDCLGWLLEQPWDDPGELEAIWSDLREANRLWVWVGRLGSPLS